MSDLKEQLHRILIIIPDNTLLFEAAGLADIFNQANTSGGNRQINFKYSVQLASTHKHRVVQGRSGVNVLADVFLEDLNPVEAADTVIVTGRGSSDVSNLSIAPWIKAASKSLKRIVSVCSGAFHLAEAGLLNHKKATTHWKVLRELEDHYPLVKVEPDAIYVRDGNIYSSAGASSGFDLGLALVEEDMGFEVARDVARFLVMYLRRPGGQSQFSQFIMHEANTPGPIRDIQIWAMEHLTDDLSVDRLAEKSAMSSRNFSRVFTKQTGQSPARFIEILRLEAAQRKLEHGGENLDQIAQSVGFGSTLNLRRTFEKNLGIGPSDYRMRFGMK